MKSVPDRVDKTSGLEVRDTCGMSGTATQQMIAAIANQVKMTWMGMVVMMMKMLAQDGSKPVVLASELNPLLSNQLKALNLSSVSLLYARS